MLGNPTKDLFQSAVPHSKASPESDQYQCPAFNHQIMNIRQVTTTKLNAMYNTRNMPVLYGNGYRGTPAQIAQSARTQNKHLTAILFPKLMPYHV